MKGDGRRAFATWLGRPLAACILPASLAAGAGAQAPAELPGAGGPYRASDLVELVTLDPTIRLDIRYATPDNFTGRAVYPEARAFLQRPAAEALLAAHRWLKKRGYGLLVYDAYRPWSVTRLFWALTPPDRRAFVADPSKGSAHNRGCAVDVGLVDLRSGREVEMPSAFDEFSDRSSITHGGGTLAQRASRDLLRRAMEREGDFVVSPREWWHYSYRGFRHYAVQDAPFSSLVPPSPPQRP